ncbi:hypothetical protein BJX68DRAFT_246529 [Aspergillus pseudodeflectus]|uniref:Uncharacterized protein n=1 Tax=Aspergillus pseudodeflectus TaxID=176178 RepID=A0ABR4JKS4_9EURO
MFFLHTMNGRETPNPTNRDKSIELATGPSHHPPKSPSASNLQTNPHHGDRVALSSSPPLPTSQCEATGLLRPSPPRCFDLCTSSPPSPSPWPAYLPSEKLYSSSQSSLAASSGPHVSRKCAKPFFILVKRVAWAALGVGWAALAELRSVGGVVPLIVNRVVVRFVEGLGGDLGELLGVLVESFEGDETRAGGQRG